MESDRIDELWTDFLEGELDDAGQADLRKELEAEPDRSIQSAESYRLHRLLGFHFSDDEATGDAFTRATMDRIPENEEPFVAEFRQRLEGAPRPRRITSAWIRWVGYAAAAALVVAATLAIQGQFGNPPAAIVDAQVAKEAVATLVFADDCRWAAGGEDLVEGGRIGAREMELLDGTAVIRFDGGAELLLKANTKISFRDAGSGEGFFGQVVVRAEDGAEGFTLDTPTSKVVDLGTEFAVKVEASGASEVHVLDGEVAVGEGTQDGIVRAGRAVRFETRRGAATDVAIDPKRFADSVREANPRPRADLRWIYEGFNYPTGECSLESGIGGKGWAGAWRLRNSDERYDIPKTDSPKTMQIVRGELNVPWPVKGGREGMLEFGLGMNILVRDLAKPIAMDRDGVTFVSLMVREIADAGGDSKRNEAFRLTLRSSADYFGPSLSFGYGGAEHLPHVRTGAGVGFRSTTLAPKGQTTFFVGKIISRKSGEDEIYFRIFGEGETFDYAEPAAWHVVTKGVSQSAMFDRLLLTSNGATARVVDEIRIGPTWRSVAPLTVTKND